MKAIVFLLIVSLATVRMNKNEPGGTHAVEGMLYSNRAPVSIVVDGEKISAVNHPATSSTVTNLYVAPGLIDVQINGYLGVDFSGPDLTVEKVRMATEALWKAGITSYFPTVITSDIDRIKENLAVLAQAVEDPAIGRSIPGFHLEGPYISPVKGFRGAHLEKYIKAPDRKEFQELQRAANQGIKLITLGTRVTRSNSVYSAVCE